MGWTDKALLQTLDQDSNKKQQPLASGDQENSHINKVNEMDSNQMKLPTQCCINCFCDCKSKYSMVNRELMVENPTISPSLAAQRKTEPRLCDHTNGCAKKCKYVKPRTCMITGGVELVPLLARRRAMQRPISLSTTDVTKYPTEKK